MQQPIRYQEVTSWRQFRSDVILSNTNRLPWHRIRRFPRKTVLQVFSFGLVPVSFTSTFNFSIVLPQQYAFHCDQNSIHFPSTILPFPSPRHACKTNVLCFRFSASEKARETWKRYLSRENSRIVDIFVGQLKSCLKCTTCGYASNTFDPLWQLSLPIKKVGVLVYSWSWVQTPTNTCG